MNQAASREAPAGLESPWHFWPRPTQQASSPGGCEPSHPEYPRIAPAICGGLQALIQEAIAGAQWAVADVQKPDRIVVMDVRGDSAELAKVAANALIAAKISFMNELANLAERLGADIERVCIGIGSDPRIGFAEA